MIKKIVHRLNIVFILFYAATAVVYEEGGFGVDLVVKSEPGVAIIYGGGEEGAWARSHPENPTPWWLEKSYLPIVQDDWEEGTPIWVAVYAIVAVLLLSLNLLAVVFLIFRFTYRCFFSGTVKR